MYKIILSFVLLLGFTSLNAQENIVKASVVFGNAGIQYERSLSQHFSLAAQAGYGFTFISTPAENNEFTTGLAYSFEGRYYFSSSKPKLTGWHLGPSVNFINTTDKNDNEYKTRIYGVTGGSQWIFDSNFTLEFVVSLGYRTVDSPDVYLGSSVTNKSPDIMPSAGVSFGYAF
ncbi:DUF3575 domain-containing protein [Flavobacterium piscinae]|uniref:DUF3575 domain-containing protein n=1 Tax=Flavobacterium piscinae TaxID=2506424 RepID=A0A4Q1KXZ0_9FLAO|nr:DUF3575 domain-containing protein [Flavobacterium piscinae]MBC8884160.1 DUF3575 domain-containing protein [Flavobacterium piscinae]RXR34745.1 DUF3575 domain-containing protein [Flavobacterium piscinae]